MFIDFLITVIRVEQKYGWYTRISISYLFVYILMRLPEYTCIIGI